MTIADPSLYFRPESRWSAINDERELAVTVPFIVKHVAARMSSEAAIVEGLRMVGTVHRRLPARYR